MDTAPDNLIIQMRDVGKTYFTGGAPFAALRHVTLNIRQGEFLGITGKSGAGKTTLLNLLSGVSELTSGEILFHWPGDRAPSPARIHPSFACRRTAPAGFQRSGEFVAARAQRANSPISSGAKRRLL